MVPGHGRGAPQPSRMVQIERFGDGAVQRPQERKQLPEGTIQGSLHLPWPRSINDEADLHIRYTHPRLLLLARILRRCRRASIGTGGNHR